MNSLDYNEVRQAVPRWILNTISLFILVVRVGKLFPESLFLNLLFLFIISLYYSYGLYDLLNL